MNDFAETCKTTLQYTTCRMKAQGAKHLLVTKIAETDVPAR